MTLYILPEGQAEFLNFISPWILTCQIFYLYIMYM